METLPVEHAEAERASGIGAADSARDFLALTKPRITLVVLLTGGAGMALAPGSIAPFKLLASLLGTVLVVSAANALNMWWERDTDGLMERTRKRPLPAGRLSPEAALAFGLLLAVFATPLLFLVNFATGMLGLFALTSYVAVYTPLKRVTPFALQVGAIPGAIPPLMGWTSVTGNAGAGGLFLFALLFVWQVPHFLAIGLFRTADYARAGLLVHPVVRGERASRASIVAHAVLLTATSLAPLPLHLAGWAYGLVALILGGVFVGMAARGMALPPGDAVARWARRVFGYSIIYLVLLLAALLIDARHAQASRHGDLPRYGEVPAFLMTDQTGQPASGKALSGKVWIADFVFTSCTESCPLLTSKMANTIRALDSKAPHHRHGVRFVSFSVDPERDTPERLAEFAGRYRADPLRWSFLTGPSAHIQDVVQQGFKVALTPMPRKDGTVDIVHANRFVLVDRQQTIRGYYDADSPDEMARLQSDALDLDATH